MVQPSNQGLDKAVWPRLATEAKAEVRRATATTSGNLLQVTKAHLKFVQVTLNAS